VINPVTLTLSSQQIKPRGKEWTTEPRGLASYRRVESARSGTATRRRVPQ
jgi:hypothetical protein